MSRDSNQISQILTSGRLRGGMVETKPRGLAYRIAPLPDRDREMLMGAFTHLEAEDRERLGKQMARVRWEGFSAVDADTAVAQAARQERGPSKVDQAGDWLPGFLGGFAWPSDEVIAAGKKAGFSRDTLFKAKKQRGDVRASNAGQFGGVWHWGIGDVKCLPLRRTPDTSDTTDTSDTMEDEPSPFGEDNG